MDAAVSTADLEARRAAAERRLELLERERGEALLDGKPFDDAQVYAAKAEIAALQSAETAAAHRRREDAEADRQALRRQLQVELRECLAARSQALSAAEAACRDAVRCLRQVLGESDRAAALFGRLVGAPPLHLAGKPLEERLSRRISLVFAGIADPGGRFGEITFDKGFGGDVAWAPAEDSTIVTEVTRALKE